MTPFPVTVTASYDAGKARESTLGRLRDWAGDADGRTFVVDESIGPARWTASADYIVEAPSAHEAEQTAVGQFLSECAQAGIEAPETVLGAAGPTR
jgi:hypothetical protein